VVRVDTNGITFQVESKLAVLYVLQLIFVKIWPPPNASVNDVRKTFPSGNLKATVKGSLYGDTLAGVRPVCGDRSDQTVQLVPLFLQLFDQTLDGPFGETLRLASLPVAH